MKEKEEAKTGREAGVSEWRAILWDEKAMKVIRWLREHGYSSEQVVRTMMELDRAEPRR